MVTRNLVLIERVYLVNKQNTIFNSLNFNSYTVHDLT